MLCYNYQLLAQKLYMSTVCLLASINVLMASLKHTLVASTAGLKPRQVAE